MRPIPQEYWVKITMVRPAISVAMSVYNGERFLGFAIESILKQDFADFEFLILDDGSSDSTPDIITTYAAGDSRIRPIIRENRGLIVSLNQMLEEASAPIIARMDADDISKPMRFTAQMAFLDANPDYGVIGCWSEDIDENGRPMKVDGCDQPLTHAAMLRAINEGGQLICHPSAMYRRDIVRSVGGYHAAFKHCEDLDLWLRLASVTKLANLQERLLRYRRFSGQVSRRHATEQRIGTELAYLAHRERQAGRPDPTANLEHLPPIDELDEIFGRDGLSREVLERVAFGLRYSLDSLRTDGFDLLLRHLKQGGRREGMWRTVLRLLRFGEPRRALMLAAALAAPG